MQTSFKKLLSAVIFLILIPICSPADEGGVGFWIPEQVGSFAAAPSGPGWSLPVSYYHVWWDASGSKSFQFDTKVIAGLDATVDPDLKGQLALSTVVAAGQSDVSANADLLFPGNTMTDKRSDLVTGLSDLFPMASLRWNDGVHNYMLYGTFNIPTGAYDSDRLANIGLGHSAIDFGGAFTYFDNKSGNEFSANLGFTYNFENTHTDYQYGLDSHLDIATAHFFSEQFLAGLVGYYYYQLTDDLGSGVLIDDLRSGVAALGPQAGYFFPVGDKKWFANIKGYYEFATNDRPDGWNLWLTLAIPL